MPRIVTAVCCAILITSISTFVDAARGVAVAPFRGTGGEEATSLVASLLRNRFVVVSRGRSTAIVHGVMTGSTGNRTVRVSVVRTKTSEVVEQRTFPLHGTRLDRQTATHIVRSISPALRELNIDAHQRTARRRRERRPAPAERVDEPVITESPVVTSNEPITPEQPNDISGFAPTAPQISDDEQPVPSGAPSASGFETAAAPAPAEYAPQYTPRSTPSSTSSRRPWQSIVYVGVDMVLFGRSFNFSDPLTPPDPPSYSTPGVAFALGIDAAVFPFATMSNFASDLGAVFRFHYAIGLESTPEGSTTPLDTTSSDLEFGLQYRWNILDSESSPTFRFGMEYGRHSFLIDPPRLPGVTYSYLKLAPVNISWSFYQQPTFSFGLLGAFDYMFVFSSGPIENTDNTGFGKSSTGGLELRGGLFATYTNFIFKLSGFYRRYFLDFDQNCVAAGTGCNVAGGAEDVYSGAVLSAGYAY